MHSHVIEGAQLQIQSEEICFQSVKMQYLNSLRRYLLLRYQEIIDEFGLECNDFVLITGTGTTDNWEADAVTWSGDSGTVGGAINVPTIAGASASASIQRVRIRNPGFNTGSRHPHPEPTIPGGFSPLFSDPEPTAVDHANSEIQDTLAVSASSGAAEEHALATSDNNAINLSSATSTDLANLFPPRDRYRRCCQRPACSWRKKQYVFVQTMRFRRPALLRLERFKIIVSAGLSRFFRVLAPQREYRKLSTRTQGTADYSHQGRTGTFEHEPPRQQKEPVVDRMEGCIKIGDWVLITYYYLGEVNSPVP
jgi:hypothetical protein